VVNPLGRGGGAAQAGFPFLGRQIAVMISRIILLALIFGLAACKQEEKVPGTGGKLSGFLGFKAGESSQVVREKMH
jgi:hypothetical protein